jgi:hypothetical protein
MLLKKEVFFWTQEATKDFKKLKKAMCATLVLDTIDFTKTFIEECDALGNGLGVVLMQEGMLLAFGSRQLKRNNLIKHVYEK